MLEVISSLFKFCIENDSSAEEKQKAVDIFIILYLTVEDKFLNGMKGKKHTNLDFDLVAKITQTQRIDTYVR